MVTYSSEHKIIVKVEPPIDSTFSGISYHNNSTKSNITNMDSYPSHFSYRNYERNL